MGNLGGGICDHDGRRRPCNLLGDSACKKMQQMSRPSHSAPENPAEKSSIYDNPALRSGGKVTRLLALKTLTYRQADCLDDARQGFAILAELSRGSSGEQGPSFAEDYRVTAKTRFS